MNRTSIDRNPSPYRKYSTKPHIKLNSIDKSCPKQTEETNPLKDPCHSMIMIKNRKPSPQRRQSQNRNSAESLKCNDSSKYLSENTKHNNQLTNTKKNSIPRYQLPTQSSSRRMYHTPSNAEDDGHEVLEKEEAGKYKLRNSKHVITSRLVKCEVCKRNYGK